MGTSTESKAGVSPIEGIFYSVCLAAVWVIFDLFVFVCACLVVADSGDGIVWGGWAFVGAVALIPIVPLAFLAIRRVNHPPFVPKTSFSRMVLFVQLAGVLGLVAAATAPLLLWSYFHPHGDVSVTNRSACTYRVELNDGDEYTMGTNSEIVAPGAEASWTINIDEGTSIECWGSAVREIRLHSSVGVWTCDWPIPVEDSPIELTDDGPACNVLSFTPSPVFNPSPPFAEPGP